MIPIGLYGLAAALLVIPVTETRQPPIAPPQPMRLAPGLPDITRSIVLISCRMDDLTGTRPFPGTPGAEVRLIEQGQGKSRDLDFHLDDSLEYVCRREIVTPEDDQLYHPAATHDNVVPLEPDFSQKFQCARAGMMFAGDYYEKNPGWGLVATGCPTPVDLNGDGLIDSYKLPECPVYMPGTNNRMRCRFDPSEI